MKIITEAREAAVAYRDAGFESTEVSCQQFLDLTASAVPEKCEILDRIYEWIKTVPLPKGIEGLTDPLIGWQKMLLVYVFGRLAELPMAGQTLVCLPRKQGKTSFAAALCLAAMKFLPNVGTKIYSVATKKDQAKLSWNDGVLSCRKYGRRPGKGNPTGTYGDFRTLQNRIELYRDCDDKMKPGVWWEYLANDHGTMDGLAFALALIDEASLVEDKTYQVIDSAIADAIGFQHILAISTASVNTEGWFATLCRDAWRTLRRGEHYPYNVLLWMPPEDLDTGESLLISDDYDGEDKDRRFRRSDPEVWERLCPSWTDGTSPGTITVGTMREAYDKAKRTAEGWAEFCTKRLNEFGVLAAGTALCDGEAARRMCNEGWNDWVENQFRNRRPVIGIDLALITDMAAVSLAAVAEDGTLAVKTRNFISRDSFDRRVASKHGGVIQKFVQEGSVVVSGQSRIDYDPIEALVHEWQDQYAVTDIYADRMSSGLSIYQLIENEFFARLHEFGKSSFDRIRSCMFFIDALTKEKIRIADNSCFRWELLNAAVKSPPARPKAFEVVRRNPGSLAGIDGLYSAIHAAGSFRDYEPPAVPDGDNAFQAYLEGFNLGGEGEASWI